MRRFLVSFLFGVAAILSASAQSPLAEAQKAFSLGDMSAARQLFETVLATGPENAVARNYLHMIQVTEAQVPLGARLDRQIQALVLPRVEFNEATLKSALEAVQQQISTASGGRTQANFVLLPGVNPMAPVTLHLSDIPVAEVLRYLADLANARPVVERYAICLRPNDAGPLIPTTIQMHGPPVGVTLAKELQRLILPKVNFEEASLASALQALEQKTAKLTGGAVQARFVLKPEVSGTRMVSLHLTDIPFTEALRYLGDVANLNFDIDRYAVSVSAKPTPAPVLPDPTPPIVPGL